MPTETMERKTENKPAPVRSLPAREPVAPYLNADAIQELAASLPIKLFKPDGTRIEGLEFSVHDDMLRALNQKVADMVHDAAETWKGAYKNGRVDLLNPAAFELGRGMG